MGPRKTVKPEADWDWAEIARLVAALYSEQEAQAQQAGRPFNQTLFGQPYNLTQGQVSKLVRQGFGGTGRRSPSTRLEKALLAMLGHIPRLQARRQGGSGKSGDLPKDVEAFIRFAHGIIDQCGERLSWINPELRGKVIKQGTQHLSAWADFVKSAGRETA